MVANLTPQYLKAEETFRKATEVMAKIAALEEMLILIPKHKATNKMQADLKKKLSQYRQQAQKEAKSKQGGGTKDPFHVEKSGGGQVVLLGTPNGGKTSLLNSLAKTELKVGDYPFTTQLPAPGMVFHEDVAFQMVDLPPITEDVVPQGLVGTLRHSDVIVVVLNLAEGDLLEQVEVCESLLKERDIHPLTQSVQRAKEVELEVGSAKPVLIVANKVDIDEEEGNLEVFRELYEGELEILPLSTKTGENLDQLTRRLFELLDIIRIYSKMPGKPADKKAPFLIPKGSNIATLASQIHRDLPENMTFARVWGDSAKFPGQQLQQNHLLADKDIVEIHD